MFTELARALSLQSRYQTWLRWYPQADTSHVRARFSTLHGWGFSLLLAL